MFETDDVGQLLQIKQIVVNSFFFRKRKLFIYAIDLYIQYISGIKNNKEPIEQINDRSEQKKMLPQKEEPEDIEIEQERSGGEESSRDRKESYEEERQDNGQEEDADEDISEKLKKVETGQALVEKTVNDEETNDIQERMTDKKGGAMIEKKNTWTEKDRELFAKYEQKYEQVRDALERMSESQKEGVPLFDLWMSFQYTIPYSNVKAIVNNASWAQKDCHSYYYKPIDKANDAVVIKKGPILWGQDAKGAKERSRSWRTGETRVDVAKNDAQAPAASKRDKEQEETESKKKAIQPKWDKYEAALLVEACLKVKGGVSRNEVVSELSQTLRRLAAVRGLQIDEVQEHQRRRLGCTARHIRRHRLPDVPSGRRLPDVCRVQVPSGRRKRIHGQRRPRPVQRRTHTCRSAGRSVVQPAGHSRRARPRTLLRVPPPFGPHTLRPVHVRLIQMGLEGRYL